MIFIGKNGVAELKPGVNDGILCAADGVVMKAWWAGSTKEGKSILIMNGSDNGALEGLTKVEINKQVFYRPDAVSEWKAG